MPSPTLADRQALAAQVQANLPPGKAFVADMWLDDQGTSHVKNPATGETVLDVVKAGEAVVEQAVTAARHALDGPWSKLSARQRGTLLGKLADAVESERDALACMESLCNGKTVSEAHRGDLPPAIEALRYYGGWADKLHGEVIPVNGPYLNYTLREPVGVVAAIVPWNYPLLIAMWKLAPALAVGCTVILKPDEKTPLTALRLAELAREVGFPPGVINVVPGDGATGALLCDHDGVDKVAFTGSVATARKILHAVADSNLKKVSLELGG